MRRDAVIAWQVKHGFVPKTPSSGDSWWSMPVVAETNDGPPLNDINGFDVKPERAFAAIDNARTSSVPEGNVGGGTGMHCYEFKGGTGTASRRIETPAGFYTVGVLVQCNCGLRSQLTVRRVPVGGEIPIQACAYARQVRAVRELTHRGALYGAIVFGVELEIREDTVGGGESVQRVLRRPYGRNGPRLSPGYANHHH